MKALVTSRLAMVAMMITVQVTQVLAQSEPKRVIVVSLEDRKLALVEDGQVKKVYTVAVGKPSTPSPVGTFAIERRVANPTYHHNGKTVAPGPRNPVGTRWMGLSKQGYGIHGTNEPNSIGKAASHGCIRMARADLEELFPLVANGDTVELIGQRNEETAHLFGNGDSPATQAQPTLTAAATVPTQSSAQETHAETHTADTVTTSAPPTTIVASR
ncbi:MAG: L,D-transpeptidase [Terracidiphilus sp.]